MRGYVIYKYAQRIKGYKTDSVSRGTIKTKVTATGTVNAVQMILVGTQVSGTIKNLYVDFNSLVKQNELLAEIDPVSFEAQVEQSQANLSLARANLEKMEVAYTDAIRVFERNKSLLSQNFISRSDFDNAETNYKSADAQVKASRHRLNKRRRP